MFRSFFGRIQNSIFSFRDLLTFTTMGADYVYHIKTPPYDFHILLRPFIGAKIVMEPS